ncbi:MAG: hypothetical protein IKK55_00355, partial [Clostridia bacterium]|nr:hypothetical protein [Clostridia bacterium]
MLKFIKNKKIISLICIATLILTTLSASFILNAYAETTIENNAWDGTTATAFAGGTGTSTDPYQITNGAQLAYMLSLGAGTKYNYYKIM